MSYKLFLEAYRETFSDELNERKWIKTDPKERGKYEGYTIADLEAEKKKLKADNLTYQEAGKKVPQANIEKMAELNFALRAKRTHGKFNK